MSQEGYLGLLIKLGLDCTTGQRVIKSSLKYFAWGLGEIIYLCQFSESESSSIYKAECFLECTSCLHSFLSIFKPSVAHALENFMLFKWWVLNVQ